MTTYNQYPAMKKVLSLMLILNAVAMPLSASALVARPTFNPSLLVPDTTFSDTKTFGGPEGIQKFLESKHSILANTSPNFLSLLGEPNDPALKTALDDPQPNL